MRPVWRQSAGKANHHRSNEQNQSQDAKQQRRMFSLGIQMVHSGVREIRRLEPHSRWEAINSVIGVLWRRTDGKWTGTVDRPEVRVDPIPIPPLPSEGARIQRERITKQDIDEFGATIGCPGCNAIKDNKKGTSPLGSLQPLALMVFHMVFTDALVDWVPASCTMHINVCWNVVLSPHFLPRTGPFSFPNLQLSMTMVLS